MGLNRNAGQEILLRLCTDDWKGLRTYTSLIDVLLHELTHNVHGDHDEAFKMLNSQLKREYQEHARAQRGHTLESGGVRARDARLTRAGEQTAEADGSRGRVLGGMQPEALSAGEAAARAAASRATGLTFAMDARCACGLCDMCEECQAEA